MKSKFNFSVGEAWAAPFVSLLRGHREEIVLREPKQLNFILDAAAEAIELGCPPDVIEKLEKLIDVLERKKTLPGTKAQLKPTFPKDKSAKKEKVKDDDDADDGSTTETEERVRRWIASGDAQPAKASDGAGDELGAVLEEDDAESSSRLERSISRSRTAGSEGRSKNRTFAPPAGLEKVQLVVKWGGESTHASRYQAKDLGENMKKDINLMNSSILKNVKIYTSSERRVVFTAEVFARALLEKDTSAASGSSSSTNSSWEQAPLVDHLIQRRDLLDDSNAAKALMDGVKKKLKILLRPGESERRPELYWPKELKKEPAQVVRVRTMPSRVSRRETADADLSFSCLI